MFGTSERLSKCCSTLALKGKEAMVYINNLNNQVFKFQMLKGSQPGMHKTLDITQRTWFHFQIGHHTNKVTWFLPQHWVQDIKQTVSCILYLSLRYLEFPQVNAFHLWKAQSKLPRVDLVFLQHEGKKRQYTKTGKKFTATGMLKFTSQHFLKALEGYTPVVLQCMEKQYVCVH